MASSQIRLPNAKEFLWMETCGQTLEHCYLLDVITGPLSLEIPSCTLAEKELSKLLNLRLQTFYYFLKILFRNFERWKPSGTGFVKEDLEATLYNYDSYPESFVVSDNFCT